MTDLQQRFQELDRLDVPDMRVDIERRAATEPLVLPDPAAVAVPWWRGPLIAVGTAVVVVALVALAVLVGRFEPAEVGDDPDSPATTTPTAPSTTSTVAEQDPDAQIDAGSLVWSRVPLDSSDSEADSVVALGDGLVAVGSTGDGAAVWTSPDGIEWTRVPHDRAVFGPGVDEGTIGMASEMHGVAAGGPGVVAVGVNEGEGASVWTSPDGMAWTVAESGGGYLNAIVEGGPGLVAVGGDGVLTSVDGLTWTGVPQNLQTDPPFFGWMTDIVQGGPGLIAVGFGGTVPGEDSIGAGVWTSPDGSTWSRVPYEQTTFGWEWVNIHAVTAGGPGLVAVGGGPLTQPGPENEDPMWAAWAWTSSDGYTWSRVPHDADTFDNASMNDVIAVDGGLVAVGGAADVAGTSEHAAVWTSTDGLNWERVPHDTVFNHSAMEAVAAHQGGLVAVGDGSVWTATHP